MSSSDSFEMAPYVEKASRAELIMRWLYGFVIGILYYLWALYIAVIEALQFFHILIFGRRGMRLYQSTRRFVAAQTHVQAYLSFLTDQRPELTPDLTVFFKDISHEQPQAPDGRYCVNCGTRIQADAKFCANCGSKQA